MDEFRLNVHIWGWALDVFTRVPVRACVCTCMQDKSLAARVLFTFASHFCLRKVLLVHTPSVVRVCSCVYDRMSTSHTSTITPACEFVCIFTRTRSIERASEQRKFHPCQWHQRRVISSITPARQTRTQTFNVTRQLYLPITGDDLRISPLLPQSATMSADTIRPTDTRDRWLDHRRHQRSHSRHRAQIATAQWP